MPHDKSPLSGMSVSGGVAVDRRRVLTLSPVGRLDNCHLGNPFKIPKRRNLSGEGADADMTKSARKTNKIHWSQLAANGSSSQPAHCQNGRRANENYLNDTMKRKQVKVILTDVLLTEAGQNYLSRCRQALNTKTSELERGARERPSERRLSVEHGNRRQASAAHKDQAKSSPVRPSNGPSSKKTDVACTEENNKHLSKEIKSPPAKRLKTLKKTLKQTEPANSDENSSCSLEESNSLPSKLCNNVLVEHTTSLDFVENKSCPVDEMDSLRPTTASLPPSERNDSKQISESNVIPTRGQSPLRTKQPRRLNSVDNQNSESEHKTSESEIQVHAKNMMKKDGDNKQVTSTEEALHRNGELPDEEGGARGSVLRLSTGAAEGKVGTELGSSEEEVLPKCSQNQSSVDVNPCSSAQVEVRNASNATEPIVLSSEEEEEDSSTSHIQSQEGAKDPHKQHKPAQVMERKLPDPLLLPSEIHSQASSFETSMNMCPVMELQFSAIYMSGLSALTNGYAKITDDQITFSVKDPSGSDVKAFVATMHVHKYSVWDSGVFKERKAPSPSVLLLWVSETQLRRLFNELSIVQPGTRPAEGSTCVALCVCQPLNGVQGALLASIMDIVGLRHGTTDLLSPLPHHESLKILQNSRDVHLLQLLHPKMETQTVTQQPESAPTSAGATITTAKSQESDAQMHSVYTLCHSRAQGTYSVSLAHKPAADWTRYQHCGPARRLIQFPPPPCKGAITVTTEDLECLDSGEFLNDVIIDFYLKYLLFQKAPRVSVKRSHVFSSFFYKQLTRRDNANEDSTSTPAQLRRHQRVRTWTRHVDIFEKDFLFVPVNQEAHWYLVVVCFPGLDEPQHVERGGQTSVQDGNENSDPEAQSESQQGDGERDSDEKNSRSHFSPPNCTESTCKRQSICKRPCILIMDSLKLSVHERIFKLLREYLQAEWEVKRGGYRDFSAERMVGSHCRVPLQDNSSDCGLYLLQYAESFLLDPVVHFDLPLRLEGWFPRQKVREKREEIRDLVLHLYQFQQGSRGNDSSLDRNEMENTVQ